MKWAPRRQALLASLAMTIQIRANSTRPCDDPRGQTGAQLEQWSLVTSSEARRVGWALNEAERGGVAEDSDNVSRLVSSLIGRWSRGNLTDQVDILLSDSAQTESVYFSCCPMTASSSEDAMQLGG